MGLRQAPGMWCHAWMGGWKARTNRTLVALTGYRLTKTAPPQARPKDGRRRFPPDFEDWQREIIEAVRPYTMTGNDKLHALITATRYVHDHAIPGAIVECGVWRGGSMQAAARTLDM
ncbi:TylF/MycF/NovP-related O-methyltransferase, partial [Actinomadura adrarensis]